MVNVNISGVNICFYNDPIQIFKKIDRKNLISVTSWFNLIGTIYDLKKEKNNNNKVFVLLFVLYVKILTWYNNMDYQVLYKIMVFMSAQDKPNTKKFSNILYEFWK